MEPESETRHDLEATVAARRELGREHEQELVDGFLERLEQRLEQRRPRAPKQIDPHADKGMQFVIVLVSLGCAIPISAIAASHGLVALAIAWIGIVLVNVVFARAGRS